MNELKPEDVMEEAECCGYATGCTDCVLAEYDGSPCIVKKALSLLREKDAEIERLTEERDKAQAICVQMGKLNQAEIAQARAEAITEFAERLKSHINGNNREIIENLCRFIDHQAKKMKEDLL